jgi:hypothetical protein
MFQDPEVLAVISESLKIALIMVGVVWMGYILAARYDDDDKYR